MEIVFIHNETHLASNFYCLSKAILTGIFRQIVDTKVFVAIVLVLSINFEKLLIDAALQISDDSIFSFIILLQRGNLRGKFTNLVVELKVNRKRPRRVGVENNANGKGFK